MNAPKKSGKPDLKVEEGKKALFYAFVAALGATALVVLPSAGWLGAVVAWIAIWLMAFVLLIVWFEV